MSEISRLRWKCRRGMRELDVLVSRYLDNNYSDASDADQKAFIALLEMQDPELYQLFTGKIDSDDKDIMNVVEQIRNTLTA